MRCPVCVAVHVLFSKADVLSSLITQITLLTRSQLKNSVTGVANIFGDEIFTVLAVKVACFFIAVNTKCCVLVRVQVVGSYISRMAVGFGKLEDVSHIHRHSAFFLGRRGSIR